MKRVYFVNDSGKTFFDCNPAETRLAIDAIKKHRDETKIIQKFDDYQKSAGIMFANELSDEEKAELEEETGGCVLYSEGMTCIICDNFDEVFTNMKKYLKEGTEEKLYSADDPRRLRVGWYLKKSNIWIGIGLMAIKLGPMLNRPAWLENSDLFCSDEGRKKLADLLYEKAMEA